MKLLAQNFQGFLDISIQELLGVSSPQFRRTVKAGDLVAVPDTYVSEPNIANAIAAGFLQILSYDTTTNSSTVTNASLPSAIATIPIQKYINLDIYAGGQTNLVTETGQNQFISLVSGVDSYSRWPVTIPDYLSGAIIFEIFWSPSDSSAGNVYWQVTYKFMNVDSTIYTSTYTVDYVQPSSQTANVLFSTGNSIVFEASNIPSSFSFVNVSLQRLGTSILDTFTGNTQIHLVRMAYTAYTGTS